MAAIGAFLPLRKICFATKSKIEDLQINREP